MVSAGNEQTRPYVAANLAAIYGEAGQKVAVISTWDIEAGAVASSAPEVPGADRIQPRQVEEELEPSRLDHVYRLSLHPFMTGSAELVTRGRTLLDAARLVCDVIIVDVAPMMALHHAEALAHAADVVLVVGECGLTTSDDARVAGDLLRRIGAPVLGVALTNVEITPSDLRRTVPRQHRATVPDEESAAAEVHDEAGEVETASSELPPGSGEPAPAEPS